MRRDILDMLRVLAESYPELRICQILGNLCTGKEDPYYVTDDDLRARMAKVLKEGWPR